MCSCNLELEVTVVENTLFQYANKLKHVEMVHYPYIVMIKLGK